MFDPILHGFKFQNDGFVNNFVPELNWSTRALCGGMCYAALDYYNANMPVPNQPFRPAPNQTPLRAHLYNRQVDSIVDNYDRWAELGFNPGGARDTEFFNWGISTSGRIKELKTFIDSGKPCVLGFSGGDGGLGHQVIAVNYRRGRWKNDLVNYQFLEDLEIDVYDPNIRDTITTIVADKTLKVFKRKNDNSGNWRSYFVDGKYAPKKPPAITNANYPNDGLIYELVLMFAQGQDGLAGGTYDIADLEVLLTKSDPSPDFDAQTYSNINAGGKWLSDSEEFAQVILRKPVRVDQINRLRVKSKAVWEMNSLVIFIRGGGFFTPIKSVGPITFSHVSNQLDIPMDFDPTWPAVATLPPFVKRVTILTTRQDKKEPKGYAKLQDPQFAYEAAETVYDKQWVPSIAGKRYLQELSPSLNFRPDRNGYVFVKFNAPSSMKQVSLSLAAMKANGSVAQNLVVPMTPGFESYFGSYYWGFFSLDPAAYGTGELLLLVQGSDQFNRYDLRTPPGNEIDSKPSTIPSWSHERDNQAYLVWENYEPGIDRNHVCKTAFKTFGKDQCEDNNDFAHATKVNLDHPGSASGGIREFPLLTFHTPGDQDYFLVEYKEEAVSTSITQATQKTTIVSKTLGLSYTSYPPSLSFAMASDDLVDMKVFQSNQTMVQSKQKGGQIQIDNPTQKFTDRKCYAVLSKTDPNIPGDVQYGLTIKYNAAYGVTSVDTNAPAYSAQTEASRKFLKTLKEALDLGRPECVIYTSHQAVGQFLKKVGTFLAASKTKTALDSLVKKDTTSILAEAMYNLGTIAQNRGMTVEAGTLYGKSATMYTAAKDAKTAKNVLTKMEQLYTAAGMAKEALSVNKKIIQLPATIKAIR